MDAWTELDLMSPSNFVTNICIAPVSRGLLTGTWLQSLINDEFIGSHDLVPPIWFKIAKKSSSDGSISILLEIVVVLKEICFQFFLNIF